MRRIIGPILGVLGILAIMGLVAGIAYSAGLGAAGVVVAPGATTTVVPAVGYGWYGVPFFGFGHFLVFLFVFVLIIALLRARVRWRRGARRARLRLGRPTRPWLGPRLRRRSRRLRRSARGVDPVTARRVASDGSRDGRRPSRAEGAGRGAGERLGAATGWPASRLPRRAAVPSSPFGAGFPSPGPGASNRPGRRTMPTMKTILLVDDEPKIRELARDYLEHAGFAVETAGDGRAALTAVRTRSPDLVVLDLGLPEVDGLEVIRTLRRDSAIPIVVLTARDDEIDKLLGLELGADDYVTKPFSPRELVARVKAVLRRSERADEPSDVIRAGDVTLDVPRMRVDVAGRGVELTPTEFQLLATLARRPGRIFTRSQLLDALRGVAFESYERAIDTHVKNLRRKIEPDPREPRYVLTVYGVGYRFADERPA